MVNGLFNFATNPKDFRLEPPDPLVEFLDGQRIEILLAEQGQRIIRPLRENVFGVHVRNVDRPAARVNKRAIRFGRESGGSWRRFR